MTSSEVIKMLEEYVELGKEIFEKERLFREMEDRLLEPLLEATSNMSLEEFEEVYRSIPFPSEMKLDLFRLRLKPLRESK